MKIKKLLAVLLAFVMTASVLTGCGASSINKMDGAVEAPMAPAPEMDYAEESLTSGEMPQAELPADQKIITTIRMDAETDDMDPLLQGINAKMTQLGGYMENQEVYNGSSYHSYRYRHAYLTVRIPAKSLNAFVEHVGENANVVSSNTSTENVTLSYIATESRIKALETEQARLLELLAMAENMEEILLIESRLTEVRTELEQVNSVLRSYDNRINYSTVYLNIEEVKEYTEVKEPETFWDRISTGFMKSLKNMGKGIVDFMVGLVVAIPYLLPFIIIAVVIVLIVKSKKKKKKKNLPPPIDPETPAK